MGKERELSPTKRGALDVAMQHGRLVKWRGGFWTYPDCEIQCHLDANTPVPTWHVSSQTINGLIDRDYLQISRANKFGAQEVKPTGLVPE